MTEPLGANLAAMRSEVESPAEAVGTAGALQQTVSISAPGLRDARALGDKGGAESRRGSLQRKKSFGKDREDETVRILTSATAAAARESSEEEECGSEGLLRANEAIDVDVAMVGAAGVTASVTAGGHRKSLPRTRSMGRSRSVTEPLGAKLAAMRSELDDIAQPVADDIL